MKEQRNQMLRKQNQTEISNYPIEFKATVIKMIIKTGKEEHNVNVNQKLQKCTNEIELKEYNIK